DLQRVAATRRVTQPLVEVVALVRDGIQGGDLAGRVAPPVDHHRSMAPARIEEEPATQIEAERGIEKVPPGRPAGKHNGGIIVRIVDGAGAISGTQVSRRDDLAPERLIRLVLEIERRD